MKKSNQMDTIEVVAGYAKGNEDKMRVVADRMGLPYSTLMRKLNPFDAYQINATEIIPLVLATENLSLIEHYCQRMNILAVPMGRIESTCFDLSAVARFAREAGEAMSEMSAALLDRHVSGKEAHACKKELMDLVQCAWALLKRLETENHHE